MKERREKGSAGERWFLGRVLLVEGWPGRLLQVSGAVGHLCEAVGERAAAELWRDKGRGWCGVEKSEGIQSLNTHGKQLYPEAGTMVEVGAWGSACAAWRWMR